MIGSAFFQIMAILAFMAIMAISRADCRKREQKPNRIPTNPRFSFSDPRSFVCIRGQKLLLVYPSTLTAVFLFRVVRWLEITVFVKIIAGFLVVFAHVDFEFLCGLASFPLMVCISQAEVAFRECK